jgi:hypothetical protein
LTAASSSADVEFPESLRPSSLAFMDVVLMTLLFPSEARRVAIVEVLVVAAAVVVEVVAGTGAVAVLGAECAVPVESPAAPPPLLMRVVDAGDLTRFGFRGTAAAFRSAGRIAAAAAAAVAAGPPPHAAALHPDALASPKVESSCGS